MTAWLEWVKTNWLLLSIIAAVGLAFVFLKTSPTEGIDSVQSLDAVLTSGQPVVLEFYSNF